MHLIGFRLFAHPDEERSHQEDQCEGWKVKQLGNIPLAVVLLHLGAGKHARQRPCAWVSVTVQHLPERCNTWISFSLAVVLVLGRTDEEIEKAVNDLFELRVLLRVTEVNGFNGGEHYVNVREP